MTKQEEKLMSFLPEGYKPEPIQDTEGNFPIMKGKVVLVMTKYDRDTTPWKSGDPKDQINCTWKVETVVENKENVAVNRTVFKKYNMLDGVTKEGKEYKGADARARLATDLCTCGYDVDLSGETEFYASVERAVGTKGNAILGDYNGSQSTKFVEKFAEKKESVTENKMEEAPF